MNSINHPAHYNKTERECITVVEHMRFNTGNAMKYLWRLGHKGLPQEDCGKADWYTTRELNRSVRAVSPSVPDFDVAAYVLTAFPGPRGKAMKHLWYADKNPQDTSHLMLAIENIERLRAGMQAGLLP